MNERLSQRIAVGYSAGAARSRKSTQVTLFCLRRVKNIGTALDRNGWLWPGSVLGWPYQGNPPR
jgi:hypothetical protein